MRRLSSVVIPIQWQRSHIAPTAPAQIRADRIHRQKSSAPSLQVRFRRKTVLLKSESILLRGRQDWWAGDPADDSDKTRRDGHYRPRKFYRKARVKRSSVVC